MAKKVIIDALWEEAESCLSDLTFDDVERAIKDLEERDDPFELDY